jgi:hypothetical protein
MKFIRIVGGLVGLIIFAVTRRSAGEGEISGRQRMAAMLRIAGVA